ncbi:10371_t:CDS:2 [Ambispora gerdemannii]|uniref:Dol-P-Man:Man(5)GlcNAc(2)-PP-Dol alpha-1,3-mannosyltransferase n=1 Tax=Ambispora gerdemannii TaxID=144530 RepID=A0A9N8ZNG1_9GLOM|nr:10371_t:CDS:2 [Ambispora gerdemannii]
MSTSNPKKFYAFSDSNNTINTISVNKIVRSLLIDKKYFWYTAGLLLAGEAILNLLIIKYVAYTEIDWVAYMQEVSGFLDGEIDYLNLKGDTGPLVYPAGFLYFYSALYYITSEGADIKLAQYIFAGIYIITLAIVFAIYSRSEKISPYVLTILCLSKRIHSIFVLRLFNDAITMAFLYANNNCASNSLALSIKMNVLLFFPAFGLVLYKSLGAWKTLNHLLLVIIIQIIIAFPFLSTFPSSYINRAFEFSRVFNYKWTVNWKFLDPSTFVNPEFAKLLLLGHFWVLAAFLFGIWCRTENGVLAVLKRGFIRKSKEVIWDDTVTADHITTLMFTSNFIGIIFSRTLHYQFYSWYFHSLPFLLWHSVKIPIVFRFALIGSIEYCWNVYPATSESSLLLLFCHMLVLAGLWSGEAEGIRYRHSYNNPSRQEVKKID